MRSYTFALSLVAHAAMIAFVIVSPIFATGDLPDPPSSSTFMLVTPAAPDVPPPAPQPRAAAPAPNPDAAPVLPPDGVQPEVHVARSAPPVFRDDVVTGGGGIPAGLSVADDVIAPPPAPRAPSAPVRPGGDIRLPQKVHDVKPIYPAIARSARVSGTVILEAAIAEDGTVQDLRVLRSIALLDQAAIDAVRQWRFTPTLLNGVPVRVLMTVTVSFGLN